MHVFKRPELGNGQITRQSKKFFFAIFTTLSFCSRPVCLLMLLHDHKERKQTEQFIKDKTSDKVAK